VAKLVGGWGINDSDTPVGTRASGKFVIECPFYVKWAAMINRVHNTKYQATQHTYVGCSISEDWRYFSNFKQWMLAEDWEEYHLDKDILGCGKIYSAETCCFVPQRVNNLLTKRSAVRGDYPLGVYRNEGKKPYKATCHNGHSRDYLGRFNCPYEAHRAWQQAKVSAIRGVVQTWLASNRPPLREEIIEALLSKANKIHLDYTTGKITADF